MEKFILALVLIFSISPGFSQDFDELPLKGLIILTDFDHTLAEYSKTDGHIRQERQGTPTKIALSLARRLGLHTPSQPHMSASMIELLNTLSNLGASIDIISARGKKDEAEVKKMLTEAGLRSNWRLWLHQNTAYSLENHKETTLQSLLELHPGRYAILIGDNVDSDMRVHANLIKRNNSATAKAARIVASFIRQVGPQLISSEVHHSFENGQDLRERLSESGLLPRAPSETRRENESRIPPSCMKVGR